jgi:hypothetical protein
MLVFFPFLTKSLNNSSCSILLSAVAAIFKSTCFALWLGSVSPVQSDIPSKSDEKITVERQTSVHTLPKNYENIIESKKQADDNTPQKNDFRVAVITL